MDLSGAGLYDLKVTCSKQLIRARVLVLLDLMERETDVRV